MKTKRTKNGWRKASWFSENILPLLPLLASFVLLILTAYGMYYFCGI